MGADLSDGGHQLGVSANKEPITSSRLEIRLASAPGQTKYKRPCQMPL
ncbi:hypothetical protein Pla110_35290 [Polystyrenella longa]|uniref:Uncharacterized protein n=1 Tax=Polystyrenella longa TaxID=2528007 RepID=A0A518CRC5_9PLAN|nr:hypothetical protein Pla110_35290 [Polystyrenella longa]